MSLLITCIYVCILLLLCIYISILSGIALLVYKPKFSVNYIVRTRRILKWIFFVSIPVLLLVTWIIINSYSG